MMKLNVFHSKLFLGSLALLLINDQFLKWYYHNWLTGKLSDFAGLFCFTCFLLAFFPCYKKLITFAVVVLFIFWKSQYLEPVISLLANYGISLSRTVDWTDLIAIPVVFLAIKFVSNFTISKARLSHALIGMFALIAFTATSMPLELSKEQWAYYNGLKQRWPTKFYSLNYENENRIFFQDLSGKNLEDKLKSKGYDLSYTYYLDFTKTISINTFDYSWCTPSQWRAKHDQPYEEKELDEVKVRSANLPGISEARFEVRESNIGLTLKLISLYFCVKNEPQSELSSDQGVEVLVNTLLN